MVITLLLIVVLMAWGIPNYQNLKARRMVTDFANEMVYSFTQARAEAIRYGTTVEVRPINGDWQNGWDTIAIGVDGAPDIQVAVQDPVDPRLTLNQVGGEDYLQGDVVFNNIGGLDNEKEGQFTLVNNNGDGAERSININLSGSVKVVKP